MYINTFKYTPKDVSCQLCTEYVKKLGCTALRCPWLAERIEAGVVGYREAVLETFPHERRLFQRLNLLIKHYPGSLWSNEQHERRMQYQCAVQGYRRRRDTNAYYAAMYLLTSNDDIYRRTANCFCKDGIEFGYAVLKNTSPHNYALFMAARDLCDKTEAVTMADLAEPEVIDPEALRLIVNATLIARYGLAAFQIRARGAEYPAGSGPPAERGFRGLICYIKQREGRNASLPLQAVEKPGCALSGSRVSRQPEPCPMGAGLFRRIRLGQELKSLVESSGTS